MDPERLEHERRMDAAQGLTGRRTLADVSARAVRWLIPGTIPRRTLTLVAGIGGLGKSSYLMARAADVTQVGGTVIVVSYEDTAEEILRPRAQAAGAVLDRIHEILIPPEDGGALLLPRDLGLLELHVAETRADLVIIDPLVAAVDVALDLHKDQHARAVLTNLSQLAERHDCAVTAVAHLNKSPSAVAYQRISSSAGFYNGPRSIVLVVPDPSEPEDRRLVAQVKANWSRRSPVERHVLEEIVLEETLDPGTGRPLVTSRLRFLEVAKGVDRDSLLGAERVTHGERTDEAEGWLRDELGDGEWHRSGDVKRAAADAGIAERTLHRALGALDVERERRGFPSETLWRLAPVTPIPISIRGATVEAASLDGFHGAPVQSRQGSAQVGDGGTAAIDPEEVERLADLAKPPPPAIGDDGFLPQLCRALEAGLITDDEWHQADRVHRFLVQRRTA